ncbi:MAG: rod shape-determining protein [Acidobacteria bacterium]|nr:MAG: rod shape-determining protein [Acidobacteriota bacterium]
MNKILGLGKVTGWANQDIAIDMGTANTIMYVRGRGIVVNEPSLVVMDDRKSQNPVHAVGEAAKQMIGRTPRTLKVIRPLQRGVIADFTATQDMLKFLMSKAVRRRAPWRSRVTISVPAVATSVEARAFRDVVSSLPGVRSVSTVPDPLAGAYGVGLPVDEATGCMLTDIGAGVTETTVISRGGIVLTRSIPLGGNTLDERILHSVRRKFNVIIGEQTAEEVKIRVGSATPVRNQMSMMATGRSLQTGLPETVEIRTNEVCEAITSANLAIVELVRRVLEQTPPELAADILDRGLVLTGGGSLLRNLDQFLSEQIGIPVRVSAQPMTSVATGAGEMIKRGNGQPDGGPRTWATRAASLF